MSTELLGARGDVVEERFDAEAFCFDEKSPKTTHKQQRVIANTKMSEKCTYGPETPVLMGRRLWASAWTSCPSIWAAVLAQISQICGEIGKIGGWERNRTGSNHSNDEILGSKPQETQTNERSI